MSEPTDSSYLKYLPAIFQQPDGGKLLSAFLSPFEQVLSEFEVLLSGIDHYFDPEDTPERFLPWLASWVALELDDKWDEEKKRDQIAKAIDLYRRRGTVEGLKQSIAVYDPDLQVSVVEQAMPGGMQIGVASRIGGFEKGNLSGECKRIQQMERKEPVYYDYYVVDTEVQPGDPATTQGAVPGDPIRCYYRTDRVESIICKRQIDEKDAPFLFFVGLGYADDLNKSKNVSQRLQEEFQAHGRALTANAMVEVNQANRKWTIVDGNRKYLVLNENQKLDVYDWRGSISLSLSTGATKYHEPATVRRLHAVADTRYMLTVNDAEVQFAGDTLVVGHVETPFQFVVDVKVPTDWLFRFEMDMFESVKQPFLEGSLVKLIRDLLTDQTIVRSDIKDDEDEPGRKWKVTTKEGERSVERTGWALHMCGKPHAAPMVILQIHDVNFEAVYETVQQELIGHGLPFPSRPKPWGKHKVHRWLTIGDATKPPAYLAVRTGSRLSVYEFVGDAKWRGVSETQKLAEDGSQPNSEPPDVSRAIHAIIDDVKPSHTQYTLRFSPKSGPARLPPLPIEKRCIARLRKLTMPQADDPVHVPEDLRDELAKHNILLSDSSSVRNETERLWRIDDRDAYPLYIKLSDDNKALDVYQRSLIDVTMIIG